MTRKQLASDFNSSDPPKWKHHVFLSFRGDTRFKFSDHLYHALRKKGINVFRDEEGLEAGSEISPRLLKAIEESRISIIVLSRNYASSTWCLDELVKILACKKDKMQMVLPVFYNVDPSDIRHQEGSIGKAMARHKKRFSDDPQKVQKWRSALQNVANLSGESCTNNRHESQSIDNIIQKISSILNHPILHICENPIGLESRKLEVISLMGLRSNLDDVCMVGIYGIGGMGKTTVAKAVYNLIATQFECTSFLADVREISIKEGLAGLQETILIDLFGDNKIKLTNVHQGISIMKDRLSHRKVLLILDDVNKLQHLQALAGERSWFGSGSRVVITTRDKHLLTAHGVERTYEMKELNNHEALELLCWNAFKSSEPVRTYTALSTRAVHYAKGVPLALEVIGSNLFGKGQDEWECNLAKYGRNMNGDIFDSLRISFDDLEYNEKEVFLDIAAFFQGEMVDYVERILDGCGFYSKSAIRVLKDKCFIKVHGGRLWMHDLLRAMGREIVRRESDREPGERSRLWHHDDVLSVLTKDSGTSKVQGILLDFPIQGEVEWSGNAFKHMINLRLLIIRKARFSGAPQQLPNSIRLLDWEEYPSSSLPSNFDGGKLLVLRLHKTHPNQLEGHLKKFQNLTSLSITHCTWVKEVPDVSAIPHLTELNLDFCYNLVKIHESVGFLLKLKTLSAMACFALRAFPASNRLNSLELLNFTGCRSIQTFPIVSQSKALATLYLSDTGIDTESAITPHLLQENNYPFVVLPGVKIPRYFHQCKNRPYISFWIRKEFPTISLSFALLPKQNLCVEFSISMGQFKAFFSKGYILRKSSYVFIFRFPDVLKHEQYQRLQAEIQQDWLQVEVCAVTVNNPSTGSFKDEIAGGNATENLAVSYNHDSSMASSILDINLPVLPKEEEGNLSAQMLPQATEITAESSMGMGYQRASVWPEGDKRESLQGGENMSPIGNKTRRKCWFCCFSFPKWFSNKRKNISYCTYAEELEESCFRYKKRMMLEVRRKMVEYYKLEEETSNRDGVEPSGAVSDRSRGCEDETLVNIIKGCGIDVHGGGSNENICFVDPYNGDSVTCP